MLALAQLVAPTALFSRPFSELFALLELQKGVLSDEMLCQTLGAGAGQAGAIFDGAGALQRREAVGCCCAGWARDVCNSCNGARGMFAGDPHPWVTFSLLAAAAAKLLPSCLTLCDPIDGSPILQKHQAWISLAIHWLRFHTPNTEHRFSPWSGKIPHAEQPKEKKQVKLLGSVPGELDS